MVTMPATRTTGIATPKPAAKAILGFELLDEVCGTVVPLLEAVVEEADRTEVVMLGIKVAPCAAAGVEVLIATSMVVYGER
jgi:hypothetical protein